MTVQPEVTVIEADEVQVVRVLEPGSIWLLGEGVPGAAAGKIGDPYLDSLNGDVWGPKAAGTGWGEEAAANISPRELSETGNVGDLLCKTADGVEYTDSPTVDKLALDQTAAETIGPGEIAWSTENATAELGLLGGITNHLGQGIIVLCRNNSNTVAIPKGTAVMFAGTSGNSGKIKVAPMIANGSYPGYVFFGTTIQSIAGGQDGYVITFGKIKGVNTNDYIDGDILWCNPATPGGLTKTEPQAPNLKLAVAAVVHAAASGIIMVRATSGARLSDLHDVEANGSKENLDALHWNGTTNRWEPTDRLTLLEQRVTAIEESLA